jgi:nucleotide-binding universal stress UspA family protein
VPNILLPVDGSDNALRAVRHLIRTRSDYRGPVELHLLNVQLPIASGLVKSYISKSQLDDYYRDEALVELKGAREELDAQNVAYQFHIGVGEVAATILAYAGNKHCDLIMMGTHGRSALPGVLLGSVASRVLHDAQMPVLLVM